MSPHSLPSFSLLLRPAAVLLTILGLASQAQITQPTFTPAEVGKVIFRFTNDLDTPTSVSVQPSFADYQHGRLYIGAGRDAQAGSVPLITWWNLANPRSPVLDTSIQLASGNKPHVCTFWETKIGTGHQGLSRIWDFTTKTERSTYDAVGARGVWRTLQPPYEFNHTNGYASSPPQLEVARIDPATTARTRLKLIDLSQLVGFYIGASHPVGNLLICSASQARGVAVIDISDPVNPRVLSSLVTGNPNYTSFVHGSRLYTGEADNGVRVYDFANPQAITAVGFIDLPDNPRYISVKEGIGYCTPGSAKLCVFNAQDIAQPFTTYPLPAAADYTFPLGNMVVTAGQNGKNMCAIIAVAQAPDTQGPKVDFSSPPDRGTRQALTSRVGLVMSDQIDVTSLTTSSFIVRPLGSTTALPGTYSTQMGIINFAPAAALLPDTIYEVILPAGGVRDVVRNGLRQEFRMRFSTGSMDAPDLGLVSRYRFDESAGTTARDDVNARDGTLTNFPAAPWGPGVIAGRLLFDGADDFVNVGAHDLGNAFTVAGWVKIPSGFNDLNTVFTNSTSGYNATGLKLFIYGSTSATAGQIRLETGNGAAGNSAQTANGVFQFDQWNHVAVTVDRAKGTAAIYYNGVDRTSDASVRNDFQTNQLIQLGQMTNNSNRLRGELDDLHLFGRALYASEIEALRTQREGPIGHWRFNNAGTDGSGGNRPATVLGGAAFTTAAMEGSHALNLGATGYADVGAFDVGQSFTFSGWVQVPAGTAALHNVFGNAATGYAAAGFKLFVYGSTHAQAGRLRFETGNGAAGGDAATNTGVFSFGQWNHVAVAVDRTTGTATIFVNGQQVTADATVRTDFPTNQPLRFGSLTNGGAPLAGVLDDVRLHGRALTIEEVRVLSIRSPLACWPLDNGGADLAGFNRALTLLGGAAFSLDRAYGSHALLLDGADDRASSPAFELGNTVTLSAWVKVPATSSGLETILANGPTTYQGAGFRLFVYGASQGSAGRIQLETGNGTTGNAANTAIGTFQFDQWNHVAVTIDRAAGAARIYYNRRDVTADNSIRNDFPTNAPMEVGSMASGANTLVGRIDEVRIHGAIATASQLNALGAGSANVTPTVNSIVSSNPKQTTGSAVTFTAGASDGNVGEDLTYAFDFGDGTQSAWSSSASASHTYSAPGRYVVTAFADDGYGVSTRSFVQIVHRPLTATAPTKSSQVAYDTALNKLWIVNPDIDTVTRINASTSARDFEIPAGLKPSAVAVRPAISEVWVLGRDSGDVRIFNSNTGAALATINLGRGYAPTGLAFAPNGSAAFVTCEGAEALLKINPVTRTVTGALDLFAPPRAVAVSADSARVFVTRFLSPDASGQVWEVVPGTMTLAPLTAIRTANPSLLGLDTTADSENGGRGLPNYLLDAGISPDGRRLWLPAKKDNIQRGTGPGKTGGPLDADNTVRTILCQIELTGNVTEVRVARKDVDDQGLASAVCFSPVGDLVFVAFIANNEVLAFDTVSGNQVAGIKVGSAPSGLTINPAGTRLYVHNFLSRTMTTLDVASLVNATGSTILNLGTTPLITTEKLPATVLRGKRIFYHADDLRMSGEGYMSCASCHLDGGQDGRVWDFTDRGEGFRNTIPLIGRAGMGHGRVHWTGNFDEIQDFEHDIRNGFGGTGFMSDALFNTGTRNTPLGLAKAGVSPELDALAAYAASLTAIPKSPFRNAGGTMTAAALAGQAHFTSQGCATCHSGVNFTDSASGVLRDVGTINTSSGKRLGAPLTGFDTPTLRGVWATAPYLHRGQAADLLSVFSTANAPAGKGHDLFRALTITQQDELIRYLLELE